MFIEKQVKYYGDVISCVRDEIKLVVDSNIVNIKLFNVLLYEDVCPLVYTANEVVFEVGAYGTTTNEVSAYVFLDDVLLQKTIVDNNLGIIKIDNPMYEYYNIIHDVHLEASAINENINLNNQYERSRANMLIGIMTIIYVILLIIVFRKKVKKFRKF